MKLGWICYNNLWGVITLRNLDFMNVSSVMSWKGDFYVWEGSWEHCVEELPPWKIFRVRIRWFISWPVTHLTDCSMRQFYLTSETLQSESAYQLAECSMNRLLYGYIWVRRPLERQPTVNRLNNFLRRYFEEAMALLWIFTELIFSKYSEADISKHLSQNFRSISCCFCDNQFKI